MVFSTVPTVFSIHIFVVHEFFCIKKFNSDLIALFYLTTFRLQATPIISELIYTDIVYTINLDAIKPPTVSTTLKTYLNWLNNNNNLQKKTEYSESSFPQNHQPVPIVTQLNNQRQKSNHLNFQ